MQPIDVLLIGNALVDQEYAVDDQIIATAQLQKGTMQLCDATQQQQLCHHLADYAHHGQSSGGSAANTAVAITALGGSSFYACRVGDDALAQFYLTDLKQVGVHTNSMSLSTGQTGTCIVMVTPDAERTMYTHLGITAELSSSQVDYTALSQAKWLYIEGYLATSPTAQRAVAQARQVAQQHHIPVAISLSDPAMVQYAKQGLDGFIADGVDLIFCNEQEALMYSQQTTLTDAAVTLAQVAKTVLITLGHRGALLVQDGQQTTIETTTVTALDSNGAGDAFAGGVLYAITQGQSWQEAVRLGNRVAATVVGQYGARLPVAKYQQLND